MATHRRSVRRFAFVVIGSSLLISVAVLWGGASQQPNAPLPGVEPKADQILRSMSKTLADAKQFTVQAHDTSDQVLDDGQKVHASKTAKVAIRRPNALAAEAQGDLEDLRYVYEGEQVTILNHREKCYAQQKVPGSIDEMFDFLAEQYGLTPPLADLLFSNPYEAMTGRVRSGRYLGVHRVFDTPCHHLAFRQDGVDWQIWIEDSPRPVPRKVVITYKELPGYPQFTAYLDKWDLDPKLDDSAFKVQVPPDYKRLDLVPLERPRDAAPNQPNR